MQPLYDVLAELFEQPWYKGTHELKLVMSSLARETGRTSQAMDLLMECLADVPAKNKETQSRLHYEVALELMEGADFDGAIDSLMDIEEGTDYMAIGRKEKALMILVEKCWKEDSDSKLEEVIERAHLALLDIPRDAKTLQGIGEQLCDYMDFEHGITFYERAVESAPDNADLKKKLQYARVGLEAQEGDGRVFMGWGKNSKGEPAKMYVDRSREGRLSKGPAGSSKWVMPDHASNFKKWEGTGDYLASKISPKQAGG